MRSKEQVIKELQMQLTDMQDLLVINDLDGIIKFRGEDLYSILQDIEAELREQK